MGFLPSRAESFWHPFYGRRFRAALLVGVGETGFDSLPPSSQRAVDDKCNELNKANHNILPWGIAQRGFAPNDDGIAAWHGVAMAHLDMPTGVEGLRWRDFVSAWAMRNPDVMCFRFRRFDRATDDAFAFLAAAGLDMSPRMRQSHAWLEAGRRQYP